MILAHFQFRHVQEKVLGIEFNDAFYARYKETMAGLVLYGIPGMAARLTDKTGD